MVAVAACAMLRCVASSGPSYVNVNYHANGGTGAMSAQMAREGKMVKLRANKFTRSNYVFAGWKTSPASSCIAYPDKARILVEAETDLYAEWTYDEWAWMDRATVRSAMVECLDEGTGQSTPVGSATIKTGKRSARTGSAAISVRVTFFAPYVEEQTDKLRAMGVRRKFPKTMTIKGKTCGCSDQYAELKGSGCAEGGLYFVADGMVLRFDDVFGFGSYTAEVPF